MRKFFFMQSPYVERILSKCREYTLRCLTEADAYNFNSNLLVL